MNFFKRLFKKLRLRCGCCCQSNCDLEIDNEDNNIV